MHKAYRFEQFCDRISVMSQIRFLQLYSILITVGLIALFIRVESQSRYSINTDLDVLNVKKVNIVNNDGSLAMVISSSNLQHPGMMNNKNFPKRKRPSGLIFFNEEGDEVGGLVYEGAKGKAAMVLSLDQYKNDQILQLVYSENSKKRKYGINLWDRSDKIQLDDQINLISKFKEKGLTKNEIRQKLEKLSGGEPISSERLFLGKKKSGEVGLFINDKNGVPVLEISVDKDGRVATKGL